MFMFVMLRKSERGYELGICCFFIRFSIWTSLLRDTIKFGVLGRFCFLLKRICFQCTQKWLIKKLTLCCETAYFIVIRLCGSRWINLYFWGSDDGAWIGLTTKPNSKPFKHGYKRPDPILLHQTDHHHSSSVYCLLFWTFLVGNCTCLWISLVSVYGTTGFSCWYILLSY